MTCLKNYKLLRTEVKMLCSMLKNVSTPGHICKRHMFMLSSLNVCMPERSQRLGYPHQAPMNAPSFSVFDTQTHTLRRNFKKTSDATNCQLLNKGNISKNIAKKYMQQRELSFSTRRILEASPPKMQPYLRLLRFDKPVGTYLLFWPCTWSIGLAAQAGHLPDLYILALFGVGSFVMRGAGCIINDMWDRDFDKMVARTKTRPLASGELSPFQALVFLGGNLSVALAILLQLNWYSVFLGAASMILVVSYPLAKRYTYWPQVVLGITLNWGVLLAWSALRGSLEWPVLPLYIGCVLYTMFYDTIYSHQDKDDDMLIGVKSTALKFGDQTKIWLTGFSGLMMGCFTLTGTMCDQTWPYYTALAVTGVHLAHQLYTVDLDNSDDCLKKFKSNTQLGAIMFLGILLGTLLKSDQEENAKTKS